MDSSYIQNLRIQEKNEKAFALIEKARIAKGKGREIAKITRGNRKKIQIEWGPEKGWVVAKIIGHEKDHH